MGQACSIYSVGASRRGILSVLLPLWPPPCSLLFLLSDSQQTAGSRTGSAQTLLHVGFSGVSSPSLPLLVSASHPIPTLAVYCLGPETNFASFLLAVPSPSSSR